MQTPNRRIHGPTRPPPGRSKSPDKVPEPVREEWMMVPPEPKLRADPLNIKPRQFSRKSRSIPSSAHSDPDFGWAQTPGHVDETSQDEEKERAIQLYNERYRPEPLVEMHRREKRKNRSREESRFDWERDMHQTVKRPSARYTDEMLGRAGHLQSRFSASHTKKYL